MNPDIKEWLHLALRWIHIFAAITWVGTTYFFTWLDAQFTELESGKEKGAAKSDAGVWMVHSGGFYLIDKQRRPQLMPQVLHWFKWESALTWFSGILLFGMLYYHGGNMVTFDTPSAEKLKEILPSFVFQQDSLKPIISMAATAFDFIGAHAVIASIILLVLGWLAYDLSWRFLFKNDMVGVFFSFVAIAALSFFLWCAFSGRAAYLQVGAMLGTLMTANVWMRILPPQRRMVAALKAGKEPDLAEGVRAKTRSKHNTFIVQAVMFLMVSNHFPTITYGNKYGWVILCGMVLVGWCVAAVVRRLG